MDEETYVLSGAAILWNIPRSMSIISYFIVGRGPTLKPGTAKSLSLAATRAAMLLYTLAASLVGADATMGVPASEVSRISIFKGTCQKTHDWC